jgi:hypothetical protein
VAEKVVADLRRADYERTAACLEDELDLDPPPGNRSSDIESPFASVDGGEPGAPGPAGSARVGSGYGRWSGAFLAYSSARIRASRT